MSRDTSGPAHVAGMTWLFDVMETRQPISETHPIWVRETIVTEGLPTATPERHPYCEMNIALAGSGNVLVEAESATRFPGTVELLGPGVPHWGHIQEYPSHHLMVYFLPSVLIEMGPAGDGIRLLRRFTAKQSLAQRILRPPRKVFLELKEDFQGILSEFQNQRFGRELRLRTLLANMLVTLVRWEVENGTSLRTDELEED